MNKKIKTQAVDHLFEAILCLENNGSIYLKTTININIIIKIKTILMFI